MRATTDGTLDKTNVEFSDGAACCVIEASSGYPQKYASGFPITLPDTYKNNVYVAGAKIADGSLVTAGGRVLGVTATADTLENAVKAAYEIVPHITFENAYYRTDIGAKALAAIGKKEN